MANKLGYPSQIKNETETSVLLDRMMNDKKTRGGKIQFIVLNELGKVADHAFSRNELESWLNKWRLEETS